MDEMNNYVDLSIAYVKEKSRQYKAGKYKEVRILKRNFTDYEMHLFAFLIDLNFSLLPVYIWVLEFFLILTGIIPPRMFDLLFYIMYALLFFVSCIIIPIFCAGTRGQSFGYFYLGLKVVDKNNHEANPLTLILRQVLGFGLPLMITGYFFEITGMAVWWAICLIVAIVTPNQQSIMDLILGLHIVHEPEYKIEIALEDETEEVEETIVGKDITPIDLHIRSNYSDDGFYDVEEIFKQAKDLNMETISITDHNCARQNAAAARFAPLYGVQYIPGVEIDSQYDDMRVRILGYYIDWTNEIFDEFERESLKREKEISLARVKKFEEYSGIGIDVDSLISNSRFQTITASDITSMVFNNDRVRDLPFVKEHIDSTETNREAMRSFKYHVFGKGGPCYVKGNYPEVKDVIEAIHKAGGIAILAGWHLDYFKDEMIEEIVQLKLDGIEVFSPLVNASTTARLLKIAKNDKILISCGSDYHGPTKQDRFLGVTNCPEKGLQLVRILTKPLNKSSEN